MSTNINKFGHLLYMIQDMISVNTSVYDIEYETLAEGIQTLRQYENRVILIVNTASLCKFHSQLEDINTLALKYQEYLTVVLFPSNEFGALEPKSNDELKTLYETYPFIISVKTKLNGTQGHPLFQFLKYQTRTFMQESKISWNFTKFIIAPNEQKFLRYTPITQPLSMEDDIKQLLNTLT